MASYAYYNGSFGKKEDIKIPLSDRSIFFGDAIYDVAIGVYDRILWEDEHIERFLSNAKKLGFVHTYSKRSLSQLLREIAVRSMLKCYMIYFQLSRDNPTRNHSAVGSRTNMLITIEPITIEEYPKPMKLFTTPDLRYRYCRLKTTNLLPSVISATEAEARGCDEAIFTNKAFVTECTKSNILMIKHGSIITPPIASNILPGIVRSHVFKICHRFGIECKEKICTKTDLFSADEILITSTTKMCKTACEIDSIPVGGRNNNLVSLIQKELYKEFVDFCIK